MTASLTLTQIEHFKREAKLLRRTSSVSHSHALDQIARANGFGNWSLLAKHSDAHDPVKPRRVRAPFLFARTPEQMCSALQKVPETHVRGQQTRSDRARLQVEDLSASFISPQNAVDFAIDYMTCLLKVPRFKLYSAAPAYWEMRSWLPYSCHSVEGEDYILLNRGYKPVGHVGEDWVNYAEFPRLQVRITNEMRAGFTAPGSSVGFLFNDGCLPWHSRADATKYLNRIRILSEVLKH